MIRNSVHPHAHPPPAVVVFCHCTSNPAVWVCVRMLAEASTTSAVCVIHGAVVDNLEKWKSFVRLVMQRPSEVW